MPQTYYFKIDGVMGESQNEQHNDEIEVLSWNWSAFASPSSSTSGRSSGRIAVNAITFSHYVDRASPVLMRQCLKGTRMPKAVLTVCQDGDSGMDFFNLTFESIVITAINLSAQDHNEHVIESVSMTFTRMTENYIRIEPDGSAGETISTTYDLLTSQVS